MISPGPDFDLASIRQLTDEPGIARFVFGKETDPDAEGDIEPGERRHDRPRQLILIDCAPVPVHFDMRNGEPSSSSGIGRKTLPPTLSSAAIPAPGSDELAHDQIVAVGEGQGRERVPDPLIAVDWNPVALPVHVHDAVGLSQELVVGEIDRQPPTRCSCISSIMER